MNFFDAFFVCGLALALLVGQPSRAAARHCGGARPCQCEDVVDADYTLPADLGPCAKRGLAVASGVTLDCAGHAIRGSGAGSKDFGVALQTGTTGVTVKNCDISGFLRGLRLRGASKNRILQNTIHHNGDFSAHIGYGIDAAGALDNLFQENQVHHNADEGIHVGTASHGNTFIGNRVEDNARENVYFLRADRGVLQKNLVRGGGANSVFIKHSSFLRLEQNLFHDKPVTLRGDAHDNLLTDNEFVNAGVRFQSYEEHGAVTRPSKNVVDGGTITGAKECISFSNASGNTLKNLRLSNCTMNVTAEGKDGGGENSLIGVAVAPEAVALDTASILHVGWRLKVSVQNTEGHPVMGAKVQGFDARKNLAFEAETAADGKTPPQDVIAYTLRGAQKTAYMPLRLQVSAGQRTASREVNVTQNSAVTITVPSR